MKKVTFTAGIFGKSGFMLLLAMFAFATAAADSTTSANEIWLDIAQSARHKGLEEVEQVNALASGYRLLNAQIHTLERQLYDRSRPHYQLSIPLPDGGAVLFRLVEAAVYQPGLAQKYPSIRTFKGYQLDNPANTGRFDITPHGFHAMLSINGKTIFIDPLQRGNNLTYISYFKENAQRLNPPQSDEVMKRSFKSLPADPATQGNVSARSENNQSLRTFRIAISATAEYTAFHGGSKALGLAAIVTMLNRVNAIYEVDLATSLILVADNDRLVFDDQASDPFVNSSADLNINSTVIDNLIGHDNYDIGHLLSTRGGGLAFLGVACSGDKAGGVTGLPNPVGDPFAIDFVAHELGHQFGAKHSFNGLVGSCAMREAHDAYEPGSGSTIMAYAGICEEQNLQSHSDPYFHAHSIDQINAFIVNQAHCATTSEQRNAMPVVAAGADFVIPASTPFKLVGEATDAEGDPLSYSWEQFDLGHGSRSREVMIDDGFRPIFRSFNPANNPVRHLPRLSDVVAQTRIIGEVLPTTSRQLNFRLSVRDGQGNIGSDNLTITVDGNSGPFTVTSPSPDEFWVRGATAQIDWDVANTDQLPVGCSKVDILLSTDGGINFDRAIKIGTDNDGRETVAVPGVNTTRARIQVICGARFFALSPGDFIIDAGSDNGAAAPVIRGQSALAVDEDRSLNITFADLTVDDADSRYPEDFSMTLLPGDHYTVSDDLIIPDADFSGMLTVWVSVSDGGLDSNVFALAVRVNPLNDAPQISPNKVLAMDEDSTMALTGDSLAIIDVDNTLDEMVIVVLKGDHYTTDGTSITPVSDFNGQLTVNVTVSDGVIDTALEYLLKVDVRPVNDRPTALNDRFTVQQNSDNNVFMLLTNDSDVDGDDLRIESVAYSGNATVTAENTQLLYTPANNFSGNETLSYVVVDGHGGRATGQVSITVKAQSVVTVTDSSSDSSSGGGGGGGSLSLLLMTGLLSCALATRYRRQGELRFF